MKDPKDSKSAHGAKKGMGEKQTDSARKKTPMGCDDKPGAAGSKRTHRERGYTYREVLEHLLSITKDEEGRRLLTDSIKRAIAREQGLEE